MTVHPDVTTFVAFMFVNSVLVTLFFFTAMLVFGYDFVKIDVNICKLSNYIRAIAIYTYFG